MERQLPDRASRARRRQTFRGAPRGRAPAREAAPRGRPDPSSRRAAFPTRSRLPFPAVFSSPSHTYTFQQPETRLIAGTRRAAR